MTTLSCFTKLLPYMACLFFVFVFAFAFVKDGGQGTLTKDLRLATPSSSIHYLLFSILFSIQTMLSDDYPSHFTSYVFVHDNIRLQLNYKNR